MTEATGSVRTDDGVRLAYRRLGEGPIVLVPSLCWLGRDLEALAQRCTVVFFDIRGQGASDAVADAEAGFERDVQDTECVRQGLGLGRVRLLGWSYHGAVCARYALAHREHVERLALVAPVAPRAQPHWRHYLDSFAKRLDGKGLAALERQRRQGLPAQNPMAWCRAHTRLLLGVYAADPACLERMHSTPCVAPNLDPEKVNKQMLRTIEGMGDYDWRQEMRGLDVPALLVHGDRDPVPIAGSDEWAQALPDVRFHRLPGCGHLPWLEQPERFFPLVEPFLAGET